MASLVRKTLRDYRRVLLGWLIGLAAFTAMYTPFYGKFDKQGEAEVAALPEGVREAFHWQDMTSAAGYLEATIFGVFGPFLLIGFAALLGNRGVAVPEESGVLDLYLANPISRRRFLAVRYAVLAGGVTGVAATVWAITMVFRVTLPIPLSVAELTATALGMLLVALGFGSLAFAVGAATGRRGTVLAVTGSAAVGTYVLRVLADLIDGLGWLRWLSPFHYYLGGDPLRHGFSPGYLLVLAGIVVALAAVAFVVFDRRDVGV